MNRFALCLIPFLLLGCKPRQADFIMTGTLIGATCKAGNIYYPRGGGALPTEDECLVAVRSESGETKGFAADANYSRSIGREVTVIKVDEDEYRVLENSK